MSVLNILNHCRLKPSAGLEDERIKHPVSGMPGLYLISIFVYSFINH